MFTGLIEDVGTVEAVQTTPAGSRMTVAAKAVLAGMALGDSIAVDGACMTVVACDAERFSFEVSPESLSKTIMERYQPGTRVNLERPLTPTSRLGGHFVTGHVDGQIELLDKQPVGNSWVYRFRVLDRTLVPLLIQKGSVAVSGISLTVNDLQADTFSVALIPHTLAHTTLETVEAGARLNVEMDLLGKYVQRLLQSGDLSQIPVSQAPSFQSLNLKSPQLAGQHA